MGSCFFSARIALFSSRSYFCRKEWSTMADMSSSGLPQPTRVPALRIKGKS